MAAPRWRRTGACSRAGSAPTAREQRATATRALVLLLLGVALLLAAPAARRGAASAASAALARALSLAPLSASAVAADTNADGDDALPPPIHGGGAARWADASRAGAALHLKIYLFEVLTPAEVLSGAAPPALRQVGPWTYERRLWRTPVAPPAPAGGVGGAQQTHVHDDNDGTLWCGARFAGGLFFLAMRCGRRCRPCRQTTPR